MSGRIFQNVVLQLKENTDRTVGVIDGEGIVIACSELAMIGQRWAEHVPAINAAGGAIVTSEGKTFKALNGWGTQFDYAAFAFGDNEISKTVCAMATVALNAAKSYYEEKHDRGSFIKDIISDNIMLGDIYVRAKELRVTADVPRGVFVVRTLTGGAPHLLGGRCRCDQLGKLCFQFLQFPRQGIVFKILQLRRILIVVKPVVFLNNCAQLFHALFSLFQFQIFHSPAI